MQCFAGYSDAHCSAHWHESCRFITAAMLHARLGPFRIFQPFFFGGGVEANDPETVEANDPYCMTYKYSYPYLKMGSLFGQKYFRSNHFLMQY